MSTKPLIKMGEIPQAEITYTYFHVGYPFMNEHQLMIGESTCNLFYKARRFDNFAPLFQNFLIAHRGNYARSDYRSGL